MQRSSTEGQRAQQIGGQPRTNDDHDELENPERVPSFLTARELQAKEPGKGESRGDSGGDRHANASFEGERGEPAITKDKPARGKRGQPEAQSDELLGKGDGGTPRQAP